MVAYSEGNVVNFQLTRAVGGLMPIGRLDCQIEPNWNVIRRFFPAPYVAIDPDFAEAIGGLRR
jgi:hypothetical protein